MKVSPKYFAIVMIGLVYPTTNTRLEPTSRGTIVYYDVMQDEVVIAADSRGTDPDGKHLDTQCKISAYNNKGVFAGFGSDHVDITIRNQKPVTWDAHKVAKRSFTVAERSKTTKPVSQVAARYWATAAKKTFQPALTDDPEDFAATLERNHFGIVGAVFASIDAKGSLSVFEVVVNYIPDPKAPPTITTHVDPIGHFQTGAQGFTTVPQEFEVLKTPRSKAEFTKWQNSLAPADREGVRFRELRAIQFAKWTVEFDTSGDVGGSVDAIVLGPKGVQWLAKKDSCKAAE